MEYYAENKRGRKKREWVKNAIIIFLVILLILTFFSNTIMNYSLPEVAAQYPQTTSITSKIRGNGIVQAAQSYNVTVQEQRTVASVGVKAGDEVKEGQTLLTLDETESTELADARLAYEALKLEYEKMLLDTGDQSAASDQAMQQLKDAVAEASTELGKAQVYENNLKGYKNAVTAAETTLSTKEGIVSDIQTQIALLENQKANLAVSNTEYLDMVKKVKDAATAEEKKQKELQPKLDAANAVLENPEATEEEIAAAEADIAAVDQEIAPLTAARVAAEKARDDKFDALTLSLDQAIALQNQDLIYAQAEVTDAQAALGKAQDNLSKYQEDNSDVMSVSSAQDMLKSAQDALEAAQASAKDTEEQQSYEDELAKKDLEAKKTELERAEKKVKDLEENASAVKIVSRYSGVVKEINIAAGDTTTPDEPLIVVELTEKGYTLTATVTKDQARTLKEGSEAEITNIWNSDIKLILASIDADKSDPANSRTLTFAVKGENITVGENLAFSVGDKNATYDVVVPSSAIHTDADGSFVYVVTAKNSPLGNRYSIRKKNVTVLASDELNSAISGEVTTADFVVTTSTVPIEAGSQVRIAE